MATDPTTSSSVPPAGSTVNYIQPQYYSDTASQVAGGVQDMLGDNGYLNNVMGHWYGSGQNQGAGQGALGAFSAYDPSKQQGFMNPYTEDAAKEVMRLSNQNLNENVIPGINSTFTGAGQFGSSRDQDFMNRAVRDNQTSINGALSTMFKNAQDTANQQYKDWTQMGVNSSQQDYKNWLDQANYPVSALGALGQVTGNIKSSPTAVSTQAGDLTAFERALAAMGATQNGLSSGSLDSILNMIGLGGTNQPAA